MGNLENAKDLGQSIYTKAEVNVDFAHKVSSIDGLASLGSSTPTVIVTDTDRGGIFVWSESGTANGGTVFAGSSGYWVRQYDGAVNVKWFGAKGDGVTDDTVPIQIALNEANIIIFPKESVFAITNLVLNNKNNFVIIIEGIIKNIAPKAGATATDVNSTKRGEYATFKITNCSNFSIIGEGFINPRYRESFFIGLNNDGTSASCSDFKISVDVIGEELNDNLHINVLRYCSSFDIENMTIKKCGKKPPYINNSTAYYYNWVENMLVWDCNLFSIRNINSSYSSMNGIYIGSNNKAFKIKGNTLEYNAGSGIQGAYSSFGNFPVDFIVSNNIIQYNRADGLDLNNNGTLIDCGATISNNIYRWNGWGTEDETASSPTNDGSGIATIKNIKKVTLTGNTVLESSRTGLYLYGAFDIIATGNIINRPTGDLGEGIYIDSGYNIDISHNTVNVKATIPAFKLYSSSSNTNVSINNNNMAGLIQFAGGAYDNCSFNGNIVTATTQITMPINSNGNKFTITGGGQNGIYLISPYINFTNNYVNATNYALISPSGLNGINIEHNTLIGGNGGLRIDTNNSSKISGNYASSGGSPAIHLLSCTNCEISHNKAYSYSGNSIRVESTCTSTNKWGNYIIGGPTSYDGTYGINF